MTSKPFNDLTFVLKESGSNRPVREIETSAVHYDAKENIGRISKYGQFNSIIFSPPYANALDGGKHYRITSKTKVHDKITTDKNLPKAYTLDDNDNIGNISEYGQFNSIVFSPPFGEQHGKGGSIFNANGSVTEKFRRKFHSSKVRRLGFLDASSPNNIDNFRYGTTYLGEMFKVYSECYRVLAPGKFMVVVVKDIKKNSLTIPLAADHQALSVSWIPALRHSHQQDILSFVLSSGQGEEGSGQGNRASIEEP